MQKLGKATRTPMSSLVSLLSFAYLLGGEEQLTWGDGNFLMLCKRCVVFGMDVVAVLC